MFAGIGGFRSGLEAAGGFRCVGYCEIDPYPRRAYEALYDIEEEVFYQDARTIDSDTLPDLDLICGGFPCQSFSIAGRRGGFADTRGTLFFEIARIAEAKRPRYQSTIRTEYALEVEAMDDGEIRETRQDAIAYNESLLPIRYDRGALQAATESYNELLNLHGSGLMGYVEIPKIDVNLPIYHGTSEEVLQKGVGHLIGSSLPIGGKGFHSVLTGHSGVAGARLFSDLDQLATGDKFFLHILGATLAYEVTETNTVLPYETDLLLAESDEDLCTLVTCTPYGVNSHRLLVRGERIPYEAIVKTELHGNAPYMASAKSTWKEQYTKSLLIGGGISVSILSIGLAVEMLLKKRRKQHET